MQTSESVFWNCLQRSLTGSGMHRDQHRLMVPLPQVPYRTAKKTPLLKSGLKWSEYRKVPGALVHGEQLKDSCTDDHSDRSREQHRLIAPLPQVPYRTVEMVPLLKTELKSSVALVDSEQLHDCSKTITWQQEAAQAHCLTTAQVPDWIVEVNPLLKTELK